MRHVVAASASGSFAGTDNGPPTLQLVAQEKQMAGSSNCAVSTAATTSSSSSTTTTTTTTAANSDARLPEQTTTASSSSETAGNAKTVLQPVTYFKTTVLPPQPNWQAALAALQAALMATSSNPAATLPASSNLSSGVLRWEVTLPRGGPTGLSDSGVPGFTALQWLQGQEVLRKTLHQVYFSGRLSTAPATAGTAAAEAAATGWCAVAGLGAAWLWQGFAGQGFDAGVMTGLQRFLSEAHPRLRILGGSR
jgi:hypothetical protein